VECSKWVLSVLDHFTDTGKMVWQSTHKLCLKVPPGTKVIIKTP
jgi:hypothetical protein